MRMLLAFLVLASGAYAEPLDVLCAGDSISGATQPEWIGYSWYIEESQPEWNVSRISIFHTQHALEQYVQTPELFQDHDVIYFNTGLHSLRADRFEDIETYKENLAKFTDLMLATGATVVFRTTTPVAEGASGGRDYSLVAVYNAAAMGVMADRPDVVVDDVYSFLLPYYSQDPRKGGDNLFTDGTHWRTDRQQQLIAPHIVDVISEAVVDRGRDGAVDRADLSEWRRGASDSPEYPTCSSVLRPATCRRELLSSRQPALRRCCRCCCRPRCSRARPPHKPSRAP